MMKHCCDTSLDSIAPRFSPAGRFAGDKEIIRGNPAIKLSELRRPRIKFDKLADDGIFTRVSMAERGFISIFLRVTAKQSKQAYRSRAAGGLWIDLVEIAQHGIDRCVHAVEIKA